MDPGTYCYNGPIKCRLLHFKIDKEWFYREATEPPGEKRSPVVISSSDGQMFANRLRKNMKNVGRWAKKGGRSPLVSRSI